MTHPEEAGLLSKEDLARLPAYDPPAVPPDGFNYAAMRAAMRAWMLRVMAASFGIPAGRIGHTDTPAAP